MRFRLVVPGLLSLGLLLGACSAGPGTVASSSQSASPSATEVATTPSPASPDPTMSLPSMPPDKDGPNDLAEFDCTTAARFQQAGSEMAAPVNIADVRVGAHDVFDRIVFEYSVGIGAYDIERASAPFYQDASGRELTMAGDSFFRIRLPGTTKQLPDGSLSYHGPTSFSPTDTSHVVSLVEGGDFEAASTWYVGVRGLGACIRVTALEQPNRLVVDIAQLAAS
jgi:hypothetical protein